MSSSAYLQLLLDMPEEERRLYLLEELANDAEQYLKQMVNSNYDDDDLVQQFVQSALSVLDDNQELAELYTKAAQLTKSSRFTIADIRKQREKIQWQKRQLAEAKQATVKRDISSSNSES